MTPINMIDVAQHFAEYINLVVTRGERFTLLREGTPVAELGPVLQVVRLEDLPTLLASLPGLTPAAAETSERAVEEGRSYPGDLKDVVLTDAAGG